VEWPELLPEGLSTERLDVRLTIEGEGRRAELFGSGSWPERLRRTSAIRAFLESFDWKGASRSPLAGDASYRAYESIKTPSRAPGAVLMNAPARAEGPRIYAGRSYDAVAHRAMDVRAFVAIDHALIEAGIRAPAIHAADLDTGLLLLEDLGGEAMVDAAGAPILERYEASVDLLLHMHARHWPEKAPLPDGSLYSIPPYDREALLAEISLFPDWFGAQSSEPPFPAAGRDEFLAIWSDVLALVENPYSTWTLRDFHSPNILWQAGESGIRRVGVIDFQDALIGHPAYDVASLAQDARVTLTADDEARLKARYIAGRAAAGTGNFDAAAFERAYAIFALQRATKVLGIFTRLALSEGKPGYQKHRKRLKALIHRTLAAPVLSPLRLWYDPYL
jgi:aminoglycoside/choline kinase family phosphotransferase